MKIKGISIKKFHEFKYGHGDSRTFRATIYMDDWKVGEVSNDGWGGCNSYSFFDGEKRNNKIEKEFYSRCEEWGKETNNFLEPYDSLIEELILGLELDKDKKANMKKGYPITVLCRKGRQEYKFGSKENLTEHTTILWNKTWTIGCKDKDTMLDYLNIEKVEDYLEIK